MRDSALAPARASSFAQPSRAANGNRQTAAQFSQTALARFRGYTRRPVLGLAPLTFGAGLAAALAAGWWNRDQEYLTPESGLGYWLGIAGASLMLLLLVYPLRKRMRGLRGLGSVVVWFRLHMVFGLIGPALILFHANFRLGSLNSNVAMAAMLIVALSGIIGRYLYGKVHLGLYGRKVEAREILADLKGMNDALGASLPVGDRLVDALDAFDLQAVGVRRGFCAALCKLPALAVQARLLRNRLRREVRASTLFEARKHSWSRRARGERIGAVSELVDLHLAATQKAAAFAFYERLFGLWHVLHLPLFVILIIAAAIHVVAAHLF